MKKYLSLVALCAALMFVPAFAQQEAGRRGQSAPVVGQGDDDQDHPAFHRKGRRRVPNHYVIVFDEDPVVGAGDSGATKTRVDRLLLGRSAHVTRIFAHALNGFSAEMTEAQAIALSHDPAVRIVEEDAVFEANVTQTGATWGLDRIDQASRPLSGTYSYTSTGFNVNVYIIDTGIRVTHTEFGGRALVAADTVGDGQNGIDCNGHGTHVAGTVGGATYGVAKQASLYAVRVLDCSGSGTTAGVIAGIDWVTAHHANPAVANMSLGGSASSALDNAVRNSIASGVTYAVAAGNSSFNAAWFSPARVSEAITVGASTSSDARASYSNYGSVVDIFAPGSSITSAWNTSDTATNTISGTSMATPHVAGVAARYLQNNPTAMPAAVRTAIVNAASLNKLTGLPNGTPNRLLFWSGSL